MMARFLMVTLGAMAFVGAQAVADDGRRFPNEQITAEDWNTYFAEVKALPGVTIKERDDEITISQDKPEQTIYSFTTAKNPAHPGIIVRRLVLAKEGYGIRRLGYFAGNREAFATWWQSYDALDQRILAELRKRAPIPADMPPVQVRKSPTGTFILTITSKKLTNLNEAQMALRPKAVEVCAGKRPQLGLYRFEKLDKVANASGEPDHVPGAFKLDQEIICE